MSASLRVLDSVFDNLPLGVVVLDRDGRIVVYNRLEQELAGRSRDRAMGTDFFREVAPCMDVRELGQHFRARIGHGSFDETVEMTFAFPHFDRPRVVRVKMQSLDVDDAPHGMLLIEDISLAREAARMRETLQSLLVHDLKNPLAAVIANLGLLEELHEVRDSADARESIDEALAAAKRLNRMTVDLLDIARLETASMPLRRAPHAVASLLARVADDNRASARLHGARIAVAAPLDLIADLDADLAVRALDNLVENALRFAKTVTLAAAREGGAVVLRVADDGPGIPEALRSQMFEKYVQISPTGSRGTNRGLGLTFVRLVSREHGGDVVVTCPASGGSVFAMTLPQPA